MLVVDDLLVRPFVSLLDIIHTVAVNEAYDVDAIQSELKENQLLYELGELDQEEYEQRRERLQSDLELAEQMHDKLLRGNYEVVR